MNKYLPNPLANNWQQNTTAIKTALLTGSVGRQHSVALASAAISSVKDPATQPEQLLLAQQSVLAAWEQNPLNGDLANNALQLGKAQMPAAQNALLQEIANRWQRPPHLVHLSSMLQYEPFEQGLAYLEEKQAAEPQNLFWLEHIWHLCLAENELAHLEKHLKAHALSINQALKPLQDYLLGLLKLMALACARKSQSQAFKPDQTFLKNAITLLTNASKPFAGNIESAEAQARLSPLAWLAPAEMLAQALHLGGETKAALGLWKNVLRLRPWHTTLALRLYDLLKPAYKNTAPQGKTAALLYSFNKADDLNAALESLAPAANFLSSISVLNNGSSDSTPEVLRAWQQRLGQDKMQITTLPVNVGAPAARNWLQKLNSVANSDFALYLDDDALLDFSLSENSQPGQTPNWLSAFGSAIDAYPNASVYGLKIIDDFAPYTAQSADLHVYPIGAPTVEGNNQGNQMASQVSSQANFTFWAEALSAPPNETANTAPTSLREGAFCLTQVHSTVLGLLNLAQQSLDLETFNYTRPCLSVTGCCHLFRSRDLLEHGGFNLSFSPSQFDDLERDLRQALEGRYACFNGQGAARHLQRTGRGRQMARAQYGSALANRYKLSAHFDLPKVVQLLHFQFDLLEKDLLAKLAFLDSELMNNN